jgi:arylsulfatase A-like enzyme
MRLPNRAPFLPCAIAALFLLPLVGGCRPPDPVRPDLPNILLIVADDLGWRDLSAYGNPNLQTPNIDRLAAEGVRFTRAFVAASSCSSSRAATMTGEYPHTNGVTGLAHRHLQATLSPRHATLAELLHDTGYETAIAGKWHVAPYLPTSWYGYESRLGAWIDPHLDDIEPVLSFLERDRTRPFFVELNFMHTHRDSAGEFAFAEGFPVDPANVVVPDWLHLPDWPEIRLELAKYYSQAMAMDAMIGRILATLDADGAGSETLIVFLSDNGPPFPGSKMTLYDRGIATPLIVRWPGHVPEGTVRHAMVSTIDLAPTLLDAIARPIPAAMQGRSFLDVLTGAAADEHRAAIFAEMTDHILHVPMRAVRTDRFKYIRNLTADPIGLDQLAPMAWAQRLVERDDQPWTRPRVAEELYDLANDPHEQGNLVGESRWRHVLDEMRRRLDEHMQATDDPLRDTAPIPRP